MDFLLAPTSDLPQVLFDGPARPAFLYCASQAISAPPTASTGFYMLHQLRPDAHVHVGAAPH
eukprot:6308763-Alexandrium_andersonii.AAC.1